MKDEKKFDLNKLLEETLNNNQMMLNQLKEIKLIAECEKDPKNQEIFQDFQLNFKKLIINFSFIRRKTEEIIFKQKIKRVAQNIKKRKQTDKSAIVFLGNEKWDFVISSYYS